MTQTQATALIVDDHADNRKLLAWILEEADVVWAEACSAEQALERLEREHFDIVFMDIGLPQMCGMEAVRWLRRQARFATLPIVAVTAHAIKSERAKILACGVTELVTKPVDEEELLKLIPQLLEGTDSRTDDGYNLAQ